MDGKGRWMDNVFIERLWRSVKHEGVYLWAPTNVHELERLLEKWFADYNPTQAPPSIGRFNAVGSVPTGGYQIMGEGGMSPDQDSEARGGARRKRLAAFAPPLRSEAASRQTQELLPERIPTTALKTTASESSLTAVNHSVPPPESTTSTKPQLATQPSPNFGVDPP